MPLPVPLAPDVIVIQDALLVAVQAQPNCVVMLMADVPPFAMNPLFDGLIENVQEVLPF